MNVSFKGIGESAVTFETSDTNVQKDVLVKLTDNGKVSKCSNGDIPCGVCIDKRGGLCSVLISGYYNMSYSSSSANTDPELALGFGYVVADANGGVKAAASGMKVLVLDMDSTNSKVGFIIK